MTEWQVVVPVKSGPGAKSRFGVGEHSDLAMAIALDTVAAALAADGVRRVIVVTGASASEGFKALGADVVVETVRGLNPAIGEGIAAATGNIAVLLGDLPGLLPIELADALARATAYDRATVPDWEGTGTALITALAGIPHTPEFGLGSNALHRAAGYVELDLPVDSGLRSDVDTLDRLLLLRDRLGPRTTAALVAADHVEG